MFFYFFPVMCLVVLLASPKPSKNFKMVMTSIFIILTCSSAYYYLNGVYTVYTKALIGVYSFSLFLLAKVIIKSPLPAERVSFTCPFCEEYISFDKFRLNKSKNCPQCKEVVTVTEDEEVHKAAKNLMMK